MEDINLILIGLVFLLVAVAFVWSFMSGPRSPLLGRWRKELAEAEVKLKMNSQDESMENLRTVALLYGKVGRAWEAEQSMRQALTMGKQRWGQKDPRLVPILKDYATLMDRLGRHVEARNFRKQIKEIESKSKS